MGFGLYVISEDEDYIHYGKELEVYANPDQCLATLMFILHKYELGQEVFILRFGLHAQFEKMCKHDVSLEYLASAHEELAVNRT